MILPIGFSPDQNCLTKDSETTAAEFELVEVESEERKDCPAIMRIPKAEKKSAEILEV